MSTNDGGPAFPYPDEHVPNVGMSLLDYFAGQALTGNLANQDTSGGYEDFAKHAYEYAAAMLAERERRQKR